jgi:hypothetical protein
MLLFVRDDILLWYKLQGKNIINDRLEFRITVADTVEKILKRMSQMSGSGERAKVKCHQHSVICLDLTSV